MLEVEASFLCTLICKLLPRLSQFFVHRTCNSYPIHVSVNDMFAIIDFNDFLILQLVLKRFSVLINSNPMLSSALCWQLVGNFLRECICFLILLSQVHFL